MDFSLKYYGERSILVHGLEDAERFNLLCVVQEELPPDCLEYVVGFDSLLFLFKDCVALDSLAAWLGDRFSSEAEVRRQAAIKTVPVVYDGEDLEDVACKAGLAVADLIELHSKPVYTVRMMGFAPGFPYLDGLDKRLQIPRKDVPLKRIEPGTVAIGGPHAGIYSVASPGGWHLLGRSPLALFNPEAAKGDCPEVSDVFFFTPGDRVQFEAVE